MKAKKIRVPHRPSDSVTRFDKNLPLWRNFIYLWKNIEGYERIWQHFEPLLANFLCFWANANCCKWPNIEHLIKPSGHTAE